MKKFQIFIGLTVLVLALWVVGTPVNADGKTLVGGWNFYTGCLPCSGIELNNCENGATTGVIGCDSGDLWILLVPGTEEGTWYLPAVCDGPGNCTNVCNSQCGANET